MSRREKTLDVCLAEMFRRVGRRRSKAFLAQADWYSRCSWTEAEEKDFGKWMVGTLQKRERWTKAAAEKETSWFLLMYGWSQVPSGCMKVG